MKINIDFEIYDSGNPQVFMVIDTSEWGQIKDFASIIEITVPGYDNPSVHYLEKKAVNAFNSVNLGINCGSCGEEFHDLPDGIYDITIKGSPDKFNKNRKYLRTTKLRLDLDKYLMSLAPICDTENSCSKYADYLTIQMLLSSAEAYMRDNNDREAYEAYQLAKDKLSRLTKCKTCR